MRNPFSSTPWQLIGRRGFRKAALCPWPSGAAEEEEEAVRRRPAGEAAPEAGECWRLEGEGRRRREEAAEGRVEPRPLEAAGVQGELVVRRQGAVAEPGERQQPLVEVHCSLEDLLLAW